jgi:hypothetical protein
MLILILMDLSSGYLLLETLQDNRSFDTWFAQAAPRLEARGIQVGHAISDRAKALIKLAVVGFECASGADTFHEQYGLSRWLSPAFGRRNRASWTPVLPCGSFAPRWMAYPATSVFGGFG